MTVLVLTEHLQGAFTDATFEALAMARNLGGPVEAVLAGPASMAGQLGGADTVLVVEDPALESFIPEAYARVFAALVAERQPEVVLVPYTSMGMDVASEVSMRCGLPLVSYCMDVRFDAGLSATCRLYAGKIEVDVDVPGGRGCSPCCRDRPRPPTAGRAEPGRWSRLMHPTCLICGLGSSA